MYIYICVYIDVCADHTVAPPPGAGSARVRRDSALSDEHEEVFDEDKSHSRTPPAYTPPKKVCVLLLAL